MKVQFIIFLSIVLTVWVSLNVFGYRSVRGVFVEGGTGRTVLLVSMLVLGSAYLGGRLLETTGVFGLSGVLIIAGSYYMGLLINTCAGGLLAEMTVGIARLVAHFRPDCSEAIAVIRRSAPWCVAVFAIVLSVASFVNAHLPRHTVIHLNIDKDGGAFRTLRIAAVTDVHLGHIISNGRLDRMVRELNAISPDVIVFGGDLFDEDLRPVIEADMGAQLLQLKARYGVFAVHGNHEYIGGAAQAARYMKEHNITLLTDETHLVADSVILVGRDDYSSSRFGGKPRLPLADLVRGLDMRKPIVVIDHQPHHLAEVAQIGADLQISGHTHHGQFWPINFVTSLLYEVSSGLKQKGRTTVYVSNGYGTWGAPMRMGNRPEYVEFNLTFNQSTKEF